MRIFWNKNVKLIVGGSASEPLLASAPPPDPHVITPAYYCKFVEFISSAKCVLLPSKTQQNNYSKCSAFASSLLLLLPHLLHLFFISNYSFC